MFRVTKVEKQKIGYTKVSLRTIVTLKKKKAAARGLARKRYSTTRIKARNFLTNIAYRRYKKFDFNNGNFVIDVYSFLLQNLNPLMINRKFDMKMIGNALNCYGKNIYHYNLLIYLSLS